MRLLRRLLPAGRRVFLLRRFLMLCGLRLRLMVKRRRIMLLLLRRRMMLPLVDKGRVMRRRRITLLLLRIRLRLRRKLSSDTTRKRMRQRLCRQKAITGPL